MIISSVGVPLNFNWTHFKYALLAHCRNIPTIFFTILMPIIFFVGMRALGGSSANSNDFAVPATSTMAVVFGTTMNLAIAMTYLREYGLLVRYHLTPLSNLGVVLPKIVVASFISMLGVLGLIFADWILYSNKPDGWPTVKFIGLIFIVSLFFGVLGVALSIFLPNETAASPILSVMLIPILMVSGIFVPSELINLPHWLDFIIGTLPFKAAHELLQAVYNAESLKGLAARSTAVLVGWLAISLVVIRLGNMNSPRIRR